jgi:hypothetical protein
MHLPPVPTHVGEGFSEQFSKELGTIVAIGLLTNAAYYYLVLWVSFIGFDLVREKRRAQV